METYPIENNNKIQENLTIQHILQINKYNHSTPHPKKQNPEENLPPKKRATFMYLGKETRTITKIFRKAAQVAYTTKNTTKNLLSQPSKQPTQYENSGVYQLTCLDCRQLYIGQSGQSFKTRFKENEKDYHQNCKKIIIH
jgi:hypothetical protein